MKKKKPEIREYKWGFYIAVLIALGFLSMIFAGIMSAVTGNGITSTSGNIAMIPLKGIIVTNAETGLLSTKMASSTDIIKMIEKAQKNDAIKGIIFEIDSPGGMVVPTDEIGQAIKRANKTTVAWIRSVGASGGYWIATATDRIFVNKMSVTGSIGVIGSYLQYSGLLERFNITYERLISGQYKDMGSPYKNLTFEERDIFQDMIDKMRESFIYEVAQNRNMSYEEVEKLATGQAYLGYEAKELGLVDEIGGKEEVKEYLKKKLNLTEIKIAEYEKEKTFIEKLSSVSTDNSFYIGKGIGASLIEKAKLPGYLSIWS